MQPLTLKPCSSLVPLLAILFPLLQLSCWSSWPAQAPLLAIMENRFEAPRPDPLQTDTGRLTRIAHRVIQALEQKTLFKEPKQIHPDQILVGINNRDGAPPNVHHVHADILKSFHNKGFDRTRPATGILVEYRSPEGKAKLLEHNKAFTTGNQYLPPIHDDKVFYGSIAGSHFNLALRILGSGTPSAYGDFKGLTTDDPDLKDVVDNGHKWWILPEDLDAALQQDISHWRNQDQAENQGTCEVEVLQTIMQTIKDLAHSNRQSAASIADIVAKVQRRLPGKIGQSMLQHLTRYVSGFIQTGDQHLVSELIDWHAACVNPRDLVVSAHFFKCIVDETTFAKCPYLRLYMTITQYTNEGSKSQAGGASIAGFLEQSVFAQLAKKKDLVVSVETRIRELRDEKIPILEKSLGKKQALVEFADYMDLVIRCLFNKPWPSSQGAIKMAPLSMGKISIDKIKSIGAIWAQHVDTKHTDLDFAKSSGLCEVAEPTADANEQVSLQNLRTLKRRATDDTPESAGTTFKKGDSVIVSVRMTWKFKVPGRNDYRKDIRIGHKGTVEDIPDSGGNYVIIKVLVDLPGNKKPTEVKRKVPHTNITLEADWNLMQCGVGVEDPEPKKTQEDNGDAGPSGTISNNSVFKFLLDQGSSDSGSSSSTCVKVETQWTKLLGDADTLCQAFWLKSKVGLLLETLHEYLPTYSEKDLVVAHRKLEESGAFTTEVWTRRDFAANEILLAPFSSQLKDTHITKAANATLGIPKHGRGSCPGFENLALDGRTRSTMAKQGTIDNPDELTGSLFWLITRTSKGSEANLVKESIGGEIYTNLKLPSSIKKARKEQGKSDWPTHEVPTIPILVNKKPIKKHVLLAVFLEKGG